MVFEQNQGLRIRREHDSLCIVWDRATQPTIVGGVGGQILELLDGDRSLRNVAECLTERFGGQVPVDEVEVDVVEFVSQCMAHGWVRPRGGV